ncbi:hypothetical protein PACTADRAFT_1786 [Pachysolen tannophilus NRRL Y-2460]|uniref:Sm domain-containing protein n=1 Tax=Pachysolen tannophilus NRRL Y-2460 TaxID=669874 RepID=A0A1E4TZP0_PACTA|nr:hypothetical protein PACTADRAFT_1786 [Pachysolen tannophilus NRRL Y-2460]
MSGSGAELSVVDYISLPFKIEIVNSRTVKGVLIAVDDQSNLLISDATEYYHDDENSLRHRNIGLVCVPKAAIVKVEVDRLEYEKTKRWKLKNKNIQGKVKT